MTLSDYLSIALAFILFRWVNNAILAYSGKLSTLHNESDLSAKKLHEFLIRLDHRFVSRWLPPFYLTAISLIAWSFLKWPALDLTHILRNFYWGLSGIILWKTVTRPKDWYRNTKAIPEKIALLVAWIGIYIYPGFIIAWLFIAIHLLRGWTSAQIMILRILQLFAAFLAALVLIRSLFLFMAWGPFKVHSSTALFLTIVVMASHYVASGWAKLQLPPLLRGWIIKNKSHYLTASAYMWGWMSDQTFARVKETIRLFRFGERLNQMFSVSVECAWLFALFNDKVTMALCILTVFLHINTFFKSGILQWPSILAQTALFAAILYLSPDEKDALFNTFNGLLGAAILLFFPLRGKIWDPPRLALWDCPFIGRIDWTVEGMSGRLYALTSQSMEPYGRFFGGSLPAFLVPRKIFHRHLGQVATLDLRDQVLATLGDKAKIEALQEQYGVQDIHEGYVEAHDLFLVVYFANYNKGRKKLSLIPWRLLRAPSIYYYSSRTQVPFLGQERIVKVIVSYREAFFDGEDVVEVRDDTIKEIAIPIKKFQL